MGQLSRASMLSTDLGIDEQSGDGDVHCPAQLYLGLELIDVGSAVDALSEPKGHWWRDKVTPVDIIGAMQLHHIEANLLHSALQLLDSGPNEDTDDLHVAGQSLPQLLGGLDADGTRRGGIEIQPHCLHTGSETTLDAVLRCQTTNLDDVGVDGWYSTFVVMTVRLASEGRSAIARSPSLARRAAISSHRNSTLVPLATETLVRHLRNQKDAISG